MPTLYERMLPDETDLVKYISPESIPIFDWIPMLSFE